VIVPAFTYHARRDAVAKEAFAGDTLALAENIEYVIEFSAPPSSVELGRMVEVGYDPITSSTGVLCFRNFVGTTRLAGVALRVVSSKLGEHGVSLLLEQVSELSASLVFGWRAPTGHAVVVSEEHKSPVPYHQLQFLRDVILRRQPGQRLQDYFDIVERNPTRRFLLERPIVGIERARNLDARSVREIFTRPDRLVALSAGSPLADNPLATALQFGVPAVRHFPTRVSQPARRLSYDTPENRFIKHFAAECLAVVYRLLDNRQIHPQMRADCREMATILESISRSLFLVEVGVLTSFAGPTQALAKGDGYKDLLDLWLAFGAHQSLPSSETDVQRLLQGRDIALLYEYWVFLKVLQAVSVGLDAAGTGKHAVVVQRGDLGESLDRGLKVSLSPTVSVSFNPSFMRSGKTAYSTPLRPDVVFSINNSHFAFDAKYRLQWLDLADDTAEDEATFLRADLYKMHTYRDAIANMQAAFIVYPGTEFVFFERAGSCRREPALIEVFDGVGAIPARPDSLNPSASLSALVSRLLNSLQLP